MTTLLERQPLCFVPFPKYSPSIFPSDHETESNLPATSAGGNAALWGGSRRKCLQVMLAIRNNDSRPSRVFCSRWSLDIFGDSRNLEVGPVKLSWEKYLILALKSVRLMQDLLHLDKKLRYFAEAKSMSSSWYSKETINSGGYSLWPSSGSHSACVIPT